MPIIKIDVCDNCKKAMDPEKVFLIYRIDFWDDRKYESRSVNYLREKYCALMLCSKECMGEYISKLIKEDEDETKRD